MNSKYASLLDDVRVKRWYDNLARGSKVTADVYLGKFGSFCNLSGLTPGDLVSLGEEELEGKILDYISLMESKGFAGSYINHSVKAVKSWLSFFFFEYPFVLFMMLTRGAFILFIIINGERRGVSSKNRC